MGERWSRWGLGYQDKVATERILNFLRRDLRDGTTAFEGVRLADLEAVGSMTLCSSGKNRSRVIRSNGPPVRLALHGASLLVHQGFFEISPNGWNRLRSHWKGRTITVRLHTNRPASIEKNHAQLIPSFSLAEFVTKHWPSGPDAADSTDASEAWRKIAEHVDMAGAELSDFVAHCELAFGLAEPPGAEPDSLDWRPYLNQFDRLHKAIATWITNNPNSELIERDYLLAAIGLHSSRSGLIQRFPEPEIPYEKNQTAADHLKALVDANPGGYLAIVGPSRRWKIDARSGCSHRLR